MGEVPPGTKRSRRSARGGTYRERGKMQNAKGKETQQKMPPSPALPPLQPLFLLSPLCLPLHHASLTTPPPGSHLHSSFWSRKYPRKSPGKVGRILVRNGPISSRRGFPLRLGPVFLLQQNLGLRRGLHAFLIGFSEPAPRLSARISRTFTSLSPTSLPGGLHFSPSGGTMMANSFERVATTGNPSGELASMASSACSQRSSFGDTRLGRVRPQLGRDLWMTLRGPSEVLLSCEYGAVISLITVLLTP
jgi:hypothetical protein